MRCDDCTRVIRRNTEDESMSVEIRHGAITMRAVGISSVKLRKIADVVVDILAEEETP